MLPRKEVAAYRLDRQLGLGIVPVTVEREVQGQRGVLQGRPLKWVTQTEVQQQQLRGGGWCGAEPQFQLVYAFDTLIGNEGRTPDSLLFDSRRLVRLRDGARSRLRLDEVAARLPQGAAARAGRRASTPSRSAERGQSRDVARRTGRREGAQGDPATPRRAAGAACGGECCSEESLTQTQARRRLPWRALRGSRRQVITNRLTTNVARASSPSTSLAITAMRSSSIWTSTGTVPMNAR